MQVVLFCGVVIVASILVVHGSRKNDKPDIWDWYKRLPWCRNNWRCRSARTCEQKKAFIQQVYPNLFVYNTTPNRPIRRNGRGKRPIRRNGRGKRSQIDCCDTDVLAQNETLIRDGPGGPYYCIVQFGGCVGYQLYNQGFCVQPNSQCSGGRGRCREVPEDVQILVFKQPPSFGIEWRWFSVDHHCQCL